MKYILILLFFTASVFSAYGVRLSTVPLQRQADAILTDRTFRLDTNRTITEPVVFTNKTNITIDGGGYTITNSTADSPAVTFDNCNTMTIEDVTLTADGNTSTFTAPVTIYDANLSIVGGDAYAAKVARMTALGTLNKYHFSYGDAFNGSLLTYAQRDLRYQLARITHGLSLQINSCTQSMVSECVYTAKKVAANGGTTVKLGLNYSPGHNRLLAGDPVWVDDVNVSWPLDPNNLPNQYATLEAAKADFTSRKNSELPYFQSRMDIVSGYLTTANALYSGTDIGIGLVMLDCERDSQNDAGWTINHGASPTDHNNAMTAFYDGFHDAVRAEWPDANVMLWDIGYEYHYYTQQYVEPFTPISETDAMQFYLAPQRTFNEKFPFYAVELHTPWSPSGSLLKLINTIDIGVVYPTVVDISLGGGYNWTGNATVVWTYDYDYAVADSAYWGAILDSSTPPYNRIMYVAFWPQPFNTLTPDWLDHFEAYVGASP